MAFKLVRILVGTRIDGIDYAPNELLEVDERIARQLVRDGVADDSKAAVDYCRDAFQANVRRHGNRSATTQTD